MTLDLERQTDRYPFPSFVGGDVAPPGQSLDRAGILPDAEELFDVVGKASHGNRSPVS